MKRTIVTLIFSLFSIWGSAQEIDMKRIDFTKNFFLAIIAHDESKVLKMTDKSYRKEQLAFLDGNKTQFVNELFGGVELNTNDYVNVVFTEIDSFEIQDTFDRGENEWEYVFHIWVGDQVIVRSLMLRKTGKKYGFIGSQG